MSSGARVRSAILTYHSLDDSQSVISTPPSVFRKQVEYLVASGVRVVPLDQVSSVPGSVAITFDDGFQNVAEHAVPLLNRHNLPATIFVVSEYCGGLNNWPSQPPGGGVPTLPLLGWKELAGLPPTVTIGAHTATHPDLNLMSAKDCEREMTTCRDRIEQALGYPVRSFAYPYGRSSREVRLAAGRHFDLAVGTSLRRLSAGDDAMNLPRIDTYYLRGSFPLDRLFTLSGDAYIPFRNLLRNVRRLAPF